MTEQRARSLSAPAQAARAVLAVLVVLAGLVAPQVGVLPAAATPPGGDALRADLRADLETYLRDRGAAEHVSAVGLTVSLPGGPRVDVAAGTTTVDGDEPVPEDGLWQIGSNTKAFTSVLLLQLEAEGRLSIDDPLGAFLPEYPEWADVPIRRLLNMTSGIPDYDERPAFWTDYLADPMRYFSAEQLVGYAVGAPATSGYRYSNTNYVLAEMVVERVTGESYEDELYERLLDPLDLDDLHYRPHLYPPGLAERQPAGYFARDDIPELAPLLGRDVSRDTLSWGRGAGGMIGTTGDLTRWERALYSGRLLPAEQQAELTSLVSTATGEPIASTSPADPSGFGLGVVQLTAEGFGTFWMYEGGTLGFRTLHIFLPESGLIMAVGLNSASVEDQIAVLAVAVHDTLVEHGLVAAPAAA
ncbi:serine hydrolase domain-containing protein [Geodermatophilus sabuli]|uniref:D-alanyl-D-alanine carboxypeptidase n=1 Tax=Geodermatophilus sabuli TaxID=1564158 RepID=A0A285EFK4_9ACTN|nr:serine hydrolase domain-containing protein [Geodermatophilus sabuli]MBB3082923.1 D-alanyl-D-alanine carboxypeptidase [Geodermatophilus sabuli]SNX97922.1 D-alanyl-D-alanine carboxypeptidase [Geodermatophilus sabuli]